MYLIKTVILVFYLWDKKKLFINNYKYIHHVFKNIHCVSNSAIMYTKIIIKNGKGEGKK